MAHTKTLDTPHTLPTAYATGHVVPPDSLQRQRERPDTTILVPLTNLVAWSGNPRKQFEATTLQELADSIAELGLLSPLLVRPIEGTITIKGGDETEGPIYQVIAGARRLRAARLAGLAAVPCIVRDVSESDALLIAVAENDQRVDVNPLERAEAYQRLQQSGVFQEEIAKKLHRSQSFVSNYVRLLDFPETVQTLIADGRLGVGHAKTLHRFVRFPEIVTYMANKAAEEGTPVRALEAASVPFRAPLTETGKMVIMHPHGVNGLFVACLICPFHAFVRDGETAGGNCLNPQHYKELRRANSPISELGAGFTHSDHTKEGRAEAPFSAEEEREDEQVEETQQAVPQLAQTGTRAADAPTGTELLAASLGAVSSAPLTPEEARERFVETLTAYAGRQEDAADAHYQSVVARREADTPTTPLAVASSPPSPGPVSPIGTATASSGLSAATKVTPTPTVPPAMKPTSISSGSSPVTTAPAYVPPPMIGALLPEDEYNWLMDNDLTVGQAVAELRRVRCDSVLDGHTLSFTEAQWHAICQATGRSEVLGFHKSDPLGLVMELIETLLHTRA